MSDYTSSDSEDSDISSSPIRIAVVGTGFAGSIFTSEIQKLNSKNVTITAFEQSNKNDFGHWTQPLAGAALNINANGMATIKEFDIDLYNQFLEIGNPRKKVKSNSLDVRLNAFIDIKDTIEEGLSDCHGTIIRWGDANSITRRLINSNNIKYNSKIKSFEYNNNSFYLHINNEKVGPFDFIIAADGRYSTIRQQIEKTVPVIYENVYNFRLLVPDENNNGINNLFNDLELHYNIPDRSNEKYKNTKAFQGIARVGIARCLPSSLYPEGSIYIFGNFSCENDENESTSSNSSNYDEKSSDEEDYDVKTISSDNSDNEFKLKFSNEMNENDLNKTADFLKCLYTPKDGEAYLSDHGKWLIDTLVSNVHRIHWSRFQSIETKFSPDNNLPILYLGDCSHSFPPSLGQGATSSIEDAFTASTIFKLEYKYHYNNNKKQFFNNIIEKISMLRENRINLIKNLSIEAGKHILPSNDPINTFKEMEIEISNWTMKSSLFREKIHQIWCDYPKKKNI